MRFNIIRVPLGNNGKDRQMRLHAKFESNQVYTPPTS